MSEAASRLVQSPRIGVLVLLVLVFAVYAPSIGNGFTLDDKLVAQAVRADGSSNPMVAEVRPLGTYFETGYWGGEAGRKSNLYRPMTILSYAYTNELFGGAAWPHHALNVLLHVWSVLLVWLMLRGFVMTPWPAVIGAAAFGLHAIHSEVVAGIVGRAELFAFCFGAQALLLLVPRREFAAPTYTARVIAGCLLLFAAFASKESAVAWVPFLGIYALAARTPARPATIAFVAAALPLVLFLFLREAAVGDVTPKIHPYANPLAHADAVTRTLSGITLLGYGLWKCLAPFWLVSDYGPATFELVESFSDPRFLVALVALLTVLTTGLFAARRHPLAFLAMAALLGFSFGTSNIPFAIGTIFGERLWFTPTLGLAALVAWCATRFSQRWILGRWILGRWILVAFGVWLAANATAILLRNGAWESDSELFTRDAAANPRCVRLQDQLAIQLRDSGKPAEAEQAWRRAIELDPEYADALFNLGSHLGATGRLHDAEEMFQRALTVPPERNPRRHVIRRDLSVVYELTNRQNASTEQLRLAWREDSAYDLVWEPLVERTVLHLPAAEIEQIATTGEQRAPGHATWPFLLGVVAEKRKDFARAAEHYSAAFDRRPNHAPTRLALGRSLIHAGRRAIAVPILRSLAQDPRTPSHIRDNARKLLR